MQRSLKSRPVSDSQTAARAAIHLHPTAPLAERVLLPGDPGRALMLAQSLLAEPRMFNHNRGLWGYSGEAADGRPLTIQATGMGGPSAAIVLSELLALGARRAIRVGTCGALASTRQLGELLICVL
jgi:uridine phosphorylase